MRYVRSYSNENYSTPVAYENTFSDQAIVEKSRNLITVRTKKDAENAHGEPPKKNTLGVTYGITVVTSYSSLILCIYPIENHWAFCLLKCTERRQLHL